MNEQIILEAIEGSIQKWTDIRYNNGVDDGPENCPLCMLFRNDECVNCPILKLTEYPYCDNTPYEEWDTLWMKSDDSDPDCNLKNASEIINEKEAKKIVDKEIQFLKSLKEWYIKKYSLQED